MTFANKLYLFSPFKTNALLRYVAASFTLMATVGHALPPQANLPFIKDGKAGFVISHFEYALSKGAEVPGACPRGLSLNLAEIYTLKPEGKRRANETDQAYGARVDAGAKALSVSADGQDLCMNPEVSKPDPYSRTAELSTLPARGIDLDQQPSTDGRSCPRNELVGEDGQRTVDNQFARVVGCTNSFQPNGQSNGFAIEMLSGSWGIVITLAGIDDWQNDNDVEVGIFANADPIQLSPARVPLEYATYAIDQDPRFRATTRGRIENGVLISDPVDARFHNVVNSMRLERPLRGARLRLTLSETGVLKGYLAGYTPVEDMYDFQYAYRNGKNGAGELAPLRLRSGSANGAARVLGHTCPGVYHALQSHADGYPDPATGKCTAISTQYSIEAVPAFVVDVATKSTNAALDKGDKTKVKGAGHE